MQTIQAEQALVRGAWMRDVTVEIDADGRIGAIGQEAAPGAIRVGALLPAPANLHSHAFQRAMAGMTERRGPTGRDTFWTWRKLMFRFLDALTPDDIEAIAAFVQMEMLEAGFSAVGEFHYVHHQPDGRPYGDLAELSGRIAAAAEDSGIGLTLLPVLYQQAGCDGAPLGPGQVRFGNHIDRFARLLDGAAERVAGLPADTRVGVAPHSLRAVSPDGLAAAIDLAPGGPIHMHLAEQTGEVDEVLAAYGRRPVEWLLDNHDVDARWCLVHCTQMTDGETAALAATGAVAGLCPITESSLGDGIFNGVAYLADGGRFGIGSDSDIRIALAEELRTLEYSQRLRDRGRAILASDTKSTGRVLFEGAARGGAQATGRGSGEIDVGQWADLVALDTGHADLEDRRGDDLLDSFIFAGDNGMVADLWSAGRHVVRGGRHIRRDAIERGYRMTMRSLRERI
ncbi:formimidoylglutamate deiminase [Rhodobium gokarnense]|uniref:Formimidoylglutamate deiminase n=1 Tax=Rhodobium gokarnense TaxID=364296 RepID=A0ABT3HBD2_9HYPH|nr:formimidoylglutamate deiminase [Rhodobium gokarnense]MCW2307700.1 formimidoylglutamate deiminase [Rhodobium gokarnense]